MQYKILTSIWFSPPSIIGLPMLVNIGIVVIETTEGGPLVQNCCGEGQNPQIHF